MSAAAAATISELGLELLQFFRGRFTDFNYIDIKVQLFAGHRVVEIHGDRVIVIYF